MSLAINLEDDEEVVLLFDSSQNPGQAEGEVRKRKTPLFASPTPPSSPEASGSREFKKQKSAIISLEDDDEDFAILDSLPQSVLDRVPDKASTPSAGRVGYDYRSLMRFAQASASAPLGVFGSYEALASEGGTYEETRVDQDLSAAGSGRSKSAEIVTATASNANSGVAEESDVSASNQAVRGSRATATAPSTLSVQDVDPVNTSTDSVESPLPARAEFVQPGPASPVRPARDKGKQPQSRELPPALRPQRVHDATPSLPSSSIAQPGSQRMKPRIPRQRVPVEDPYDAVQMPFLPPSQVEDLPPSVIPQAPLRPVANLSIFKTKPSKYIKPGVQPPGGFGANPAWAPGSPSSQRAISEERRPAVVSPVRIKDRPFWRTIGDTSDDDESGAPSTVESGGSGSVRQGPPKDDTTAAIVEEAEQTSVEHHRGAKSIRGNSKCARKSMGPPRAQGQLPTLPPPKDFRPSPPSKPEPPMHPASPAREGKSNFARKSMGPRGFRPSYSSTPEPPVYPASPAGDDMQVELTPSPSPEAIQLEPELFEMQVDSPMTGVETVVPGTSAATQKLPEPSLRSSAQESVSHASPQAVDERSKEQEHVSLLPEGHTITTDTSTLEQSAVDIPVVTSLEHEIGQSGSKKDLPAAMEIEPKATSRAGCEQVPLANLQVDKVAAVKAEVEAGETDVHQGSVPPAPNSEESLQIVEVPNEMIGTSAATAEGTKATIQGGPQASVKIRTASQATSPAPSSAESDDVIVTRRATSRTVRDSTSNLARTALAGNVARADTEVTLQERKVTRGAIRAGSPPPFALTTDERLTRWESQLGGDLALNIVDQLLAEDPSPAQEDPSTSTAHAISDKAKASETMKVSQARNALATVQSASASLKSSQKAAIVGHPCDTRTLLQGLSFERFGDPLLTQLNVLSKEESQTELVRTIMEAYISQASLTDQGRDITIAPGIFRKGSTMARAPPAEFVYSNEMFYGETVAPKMKSKGCACIGPCRENSDCFCLKRQEKYFASIVYEGSEPYTGFGCYEDGRIKDPQYPTWECSDECGCPPSCRNRSMQRGRDPKIQLEIFETRQKGWGVKTKSAIRQGTFIGIYSGELVPEAETDARGRIYNAVGRTYLFDLDHWHISQPPADLEEIDPEGAAAAAEAARLLQETQDSEAGDVISIDGEEDLALTSFYTVDAFHWGFTRYLNHSCDPNLAMGSAYFDDFDVRKPKLCITAKRDIPAGQELTITYVGEVEGDLMESSSQSGTNMSLRTPRGKGKDGKLQDPHTGSVHVDTTTDLPTACYCKAPNCRGTMFRTAR